MRKKLMISSEAAMTAVPGWVCAEEKHVQKVQGAVLYEQGATQSSGEQRSNRKPVLRMHSSVRMDNQQTDFKERSLSEQKPGRSQEANEEKKTKFRALKEKRKESRSGHQDLRHALKIAIENKNEAQVEKLLDELLKSRQ
ncbi:hypothetical protein CEF21_19220 [Bacillus sp. FJAT-42376]|uniref:hypothetical protein n=1 Tax=Bacillus sp. FJAT-42376 TaxID=2014076 RepID=UPI000F503FF6|nr:hypothetical protein [Bacillus sp. FJAT-42376]AZB44252.1 hypothetical protein CEF21_19220 [Bacillus sp. FJAT-42376]